VKRSEPASRVEPVAACPVYLHEDNIGSGSGSGRPVVWSHFLRYRAGSSPDGAAIASLVMMAEDRWPAISTRDLSGDESRKARGDGS
jgi:hypothetical protein